ncbi:RNA polymerase sigma-70 factor [Protaetiibacter intestinalis]|uniref:RNA polymerase sigma-70 factor n=1 Tax=Protaetiibacter intestinalis TaxID=2419774 RepID=A0A387B7K7_9MICO|nr:RNA polymerase sigma-70 factor [Protaetiibacter intestinalis]AYF97175.1 RNA polymerase sigma-70 factor [Protaetiibacter intestinalis]
MRSHDENLTLRHDHLSRARDEVTTPHAPTELDEVARRFQLLRPRLFGIAYRVIGTISDAEDVVQDVWLKWHDYDREQVEHPEAFLVTTTTRAAINVLKSARVRRETYVGPWLPEPIDTDANPELEAEHNESLSFALLVVMEALSPSERAAFVLREAFGYEYEAIARILDTTEVATRKLVSRAREHVASGRRRSVPVTQHRTLLRAFVAAARSGDIDELERVLASDVVSYSDGGDVVHAARIPIIGRERVVKFVAAFSRWFWAGIEVHELEINSEPAIAIVADGEPVTILSICASGDGIVRLFWLLNPAKLERISAAA